MLNRGYDSVGIGAVNKDGVIEVVKRIGKDALAQVKNYSFTVKPSVVVGHTRWATHGGVTVANAHPHLDSGNQVMLVHNGVIDNYDQLKKKYELDDVCVSKTDSEVIAQLIGILVQSRPFHRAVHDVQHMLKGTWALVIINPQQPDRLYVCRHGSPLIVAWHDEKILISSEPSVLATYKHSLMEIKEDKVYQLCLGDRGLYADEIKYMECDEIPLFLIPPYTHWMQKEMHEQAVVLKNLIDTHQSLDLDWSQFKCCILAGCGTSYFACQVARCMLLQYQCFDQVHCIDASDDLIPISGKTDPSTVLFIAFSQSGETRDVLELLRIIKRRKYFTAAVVNVVGSQLARSVDRVMYCKSGYEKGVASTKSFLSQITLMLMLAQKISGNYNHDVVQKLPSVIEETTNHLSLYSQLADEFVSHEHCFILGKRETFFTACEGSLKMKEIGYIHTEPFGYGSLKHGPLALIENGTPVVVLAPSSYYNDCIPAVHEVKARGAKVFVITDLEKVELDDVTVIPLPQSESHYHTVISCVIPIQWISYYVALKKGHNPDQPRSLAKTVTVK